MDTQIPLQTSLCGGVLGESGGAGGPPCAGQAGDAHQAETQEAFGRRLYRIHTAISHAITAHYQAMAGEVNADKLRMLVEKMDGSTIRVGNYLVTPLRT